MATKKRSKKAGSRRSSKKAGKKVQGAMREMKRGKLRSGGSGKKVTSRRQAIAIGLSEARSEGAHVPSRKKAAKKPGKKTAKKSSKKRDSSRGRSPR